MTTVHVSIGNSDDKLTQAEWSSFKWSVESAVRHATSEVYGSWVSPSADPWQNACWAFAIDPGSPQCAYLRSQLRLLGAHYSQDSIAWCRGDTEFMTAAADTWFANAPGWPTGGPSSRRERVTVAVIWLAIIGSMFATAYGIYLAAVFILRAVIL